MDIFLSLGFKRYEIERVRTNKSSDISLAAFELFDDWTNDVAEKQEIMGAMEMVRLKSFCLLSKGLSLVEMNKNCLLAVEKKVQCLWLTTKIKWILQAIKNCFEGLKDWYRWVWKKLKLLVLGTYVWKI